MKQWGTSEVQVRSRTGAVMLEFVLAFPIVLVLILSCIQIAHIWMARLVVHYAAYCAARAALVTVCDQQEPDINNDSWPQRNQKEMEVIGLQQNFCTGNSIGAGIGGVRGLARSEAEFWANKAAVQVCAWIVIGERDPGNPGDTQASIPGWGNIPGSGAAARKTRAIVVNDTTNWNVMATVEHDFALIVPIVGPIMAWGLDPWDTSNPWSLLNDVTENVHNGLDSVAYPHMRLTETVWLPKPYRTVIAAENWHGELGTW